MTESKCKLRNFRNKVIDACVTNNPKISIIVTAFNRREFLRNAIESILKQTLDRAQFEIIVTKNFSDAAIDDYLNENHVISIVDDVKGMDMSLYSESRHE